MLDRIPNEFCGNGKGEHCDYPGTSVCILGYLRLVLQRDGSRYLCFL